MSGTISGGWEFVWAAFATSAAVITIYTASLIVRLRAARRTGSRE